MHVHASSLGSAPFRASHQALSPAVQSTRSPVGGKPVSDVGPVAAVKTGFDAEAAAKPVLAFVGKRLEQAVAEGASQEELAGLLQQARDGARQGVSQAVDYLKDGGLYNDELGGGIADAMLRMEKGLDELAKQYGLAPAEQANAPVEVAPQQALVERVGDYRAAFASKQRVALEVKTADGDTVRLRIGTEQRQSGALRVGENGFAAAYSSRSSAALSIEVDGELDEGEMKALNDLLQGVSGVADRFFGGDLDAAFEQAQGLNFDSSELSSMSLRMSRQVSAYQRVQAMPLAEPMPALGGRSAEAQSAFAGALSGLMPVAAEVVDQPASLLRELLAAQAALADQLPKGLLDFADRLLGAMAGQVSAATPQAEPVVASSEPLLA